MGLEEEVSIGRGYAKLETSVTLAARLLPPNRLVPSEAIAPQTLRESALRPSADRPRGHG